MSIQPSHTAVRGARGQATPLVALVLLLAGLLLVPAGLLTRAALDRSRAQTAADAAALAGAAAGETEARAVAAANGATVLTYAEAGDRIEVTVRVGNHRAIARAERRVEVVAPANRSEPTTRRVPRASPGSS